MRPLRFAVVLHDWPIPHLDLFLEVGDALHSWKLPADFSPPHPSPIVPNAPHRLFYLDHEGEVAGGRGTVRRWDAGTFVWDFAEGGSRRARFDGERLKGLYEWRRGDTGDWIFGPVT